MKRIVIAATMTAAANIAYTAGAVAQAPDTAQTSTAPEATDMTDMSDASSFAPADGGTTDTAAAPDGTAGGGAASTDDAATAGTTTDAAADAGAATTDATTAAPAAPAAGTAAPLDVIALPQSAPAPVPKAAEDKQPGIAEVIVTAQRREQSAQDVPVSVTVLDQQQLANANITNSADLATYTPSLQTNQRFGPDSASFAIRGFTQDLRTTASVGVYFADVVAPRGQSSQTSGDGAGPGELFDLANVQVLKGPQGTLFGRNTTGGAVLLVPKKPTDVYEGYLEASGGDFMMRRIQGVLNTPLTDNFKLRFGVDYNKRDGHLKNFTGIGADKFGDVDYVSGRISALWNIADSLENYTIFTYADSNTNGTPSQLYQCNPSPAGNPFYVFSAAPCRRQLAAQAAAGKDGFYDLASTIATPESNLKEWRAINTTTWDFSDNAHLKNIFSYAHLRTEAGNDIFGTTFSYTVAGIPVDPNPDREFKIGVSAPAPDEPVTSQETFVEELQLQGTSFNDAFEWTTGAYFEKSLPDGFSGNNSIALISCNLASIEGPPSGYNCYDPLGGVLGGVLTQHFKTTYLNRAVYAQGTYNFTDKFSTTIGARYTWDSTEGYGIKDRYTYLLSVPLAPKEQITTPKTSSQAPTGQVEFSYKPVKDVMGYAKYVRGYRQGNVILAADPGIDTFEPEHVNSYEIGLKTTYRGFIPGRFNVAAFYNDLTNQQLQFGYVSPTAQTTTTIANAGKSRIAGVEVESFMQLARGLTWAVSYSYLNTKLIKAEDRTAEVTAAGAIPGTATPIAVQGDTLPFAPDHTVVTSLTYTLPLPPEIGSIDLGATYVYTGKRRSSASGSSPDAVLDPFDLLNVNVNWYSMFNSSFDLSLFGTNVLDEKYITYGSGTYYTLGFDSRQVGLPRMYGARLRYSFGI
ncbi:TonB-dependent receptor [Solimonas terrae]|uniref:TonB-dependent receptor n=1 Tax=Solimonas terrae TaxID=1396819 RepID=A0A6M2BNP0_9GAMM|nr:TonB-dependent receptor [Solimonas terrae]NGY03950.1 TonB-dependent receptor [Solimonas terrae]